jgi:hypothetical protein
MGKDLEGSSHDLLEVQSWATLEGLRPTITKISHVIRCSSYRYTYLLADTAVLVSLLMWDALHVAESDAIIFNYFQVTNSGLDAAKT